MAIIGTCGNCGGPVCVPDLWGGLHPPVPECARCGSIPANPHGPVMPMQPAPRVTTGTKIVMREMPDGSIRFDGH